MKMAAGGPKSNPRESADTSSLFEACKDGDLETVKKLLTRQNVNSLDTDGRKSTPLHFAAGVSSGKAIITCV